MVLLGGGCIQERLQAHLRALRKVLAEFLDWRMSEEKQRTDYLVRGPSLIQQPNGSLGRFPLPETRGIVSVLLPSALERPGSGWSRWHGSGQVW